MFSKFIQSPALVRFVPFAIFIVLTSLQEKFGEAGRYWIYFAKTLAGAGMLVVVWRHIEELKWRFSWEAVVAGVAVFAVWVGLDGLYPRTDALYAQHICPLLQKVGLTKECVAPVAGAAWNPNEAFGTGSVLAIFFIIVRIVGSSLVVPPLEEVFTARSRIATSRRRNFSPCRLGDFSPCRSLLPRCCLASCIANGWPGFSAPPRIKVL